MNKHIITFASAFFLSIPLLVSAQDGTSVNVMNSTSLREVHDMKKMYSTSTATSTKPGIKVVDPMCIQNAIEKRDTAVITAFSGFSTSVTTALTVRKDALKAAVILTDKNAKETARKAAWSTFKTSSKTAATTLRTARRAAWTTYETDTKACGVKNYEQAAPLGETGISL